MMTTVVRSSFLCLACDEDSSDDADELENRRAFRCVENCRSRSPPSWSVESTDRERCCWGVGRGTVVVGGGGGGDHVGRGVSSCCCPGRREAEPRRGAIVGSGLFRSALSVFRRWFATMGETGEIRRGFIGRTTTAWSALRAFLCCRTGERRLVLIAGTSWLLLVLLLSVFLCWYCGDSAGFGMDSRGWLGEEGWFPGIHACIVGCSMEDVLFISGRLRRLV